MAKIEEPKGIGFFNIKSGDTHYARSDAQIQAYINSSDIGINASRGQDFGWRLDKEWVMKVKKFRADSYKMERLTDKNGGKAPKITQILYTIYGEELRRYQQMLADSENPFEEDYLQSISSKSKKTSSSEETTKPDETEEPKSK